MRMRGASASLETARPRHALGFAEVRVSEEPVARGASREDARGERISRSGAAAARTAPCGRTRLRRTCRERSVASGCAGRARLSRRRGRGTHCAARNIASPENLSQEERRVRMRGASASLETARPRHALRVGEVCVSGEPVARGAAREDARGERVFRDVAAAALTLLYRTLPLRRTCRKRSVA